MFSILTGLCLWIPAIIGWGLPSAAVQRKLASSSQRRPFDLGEPILGLALIGALVTIANFYTAVQGSEIVIMVSGWALFAVRLRLYGIPGINWRVLAGWAAWIAITSLLSAGMPANGDTGLYHLQSILWFKEGIAPLGLANLHGRLGYNSAWFAVSSAIGTPFAGALRADFWLANALIVFFWGAAVIEAVDRVIFSRSRKLNDLFLCLTPFLFDSLVISNNMPSASPDLPSALLTIFTMSFALRAFEPDEDLSAQTWSALITAVFAVTVKLSEIPLLLMPVGILLAAIKRKIPITATKGIILASTLSTAALVLPWLIRGVIMSGCLVYPVSSTCIYALPWAVPEAHVAAEAQAIQGWARHAGISAAQVEPGWGWVSAWWIQNQLLTLEIETPAGMLAIGICMLMLGSRARKQPAKADLPGVLLVLVISCIGIGYWFFTAPDSRFGVAYFWSPALLILALALGSLLHLSENPERSMWRMVGTGAVSLIVILASLGLVAGIAARIWGLTASNHNEIVAVSLPTQTYDTLITTNGAAIHRPQVGEQCWDIPVPCTPYFDRDLRVTRAPNGQYTAFYPASSRTPAD